MRTSHQTGGERRGKIRVDFKTQIVLKAGAAKIQVEGSSRDLSLTGIFVHTAEDLPRGTKCRVEILLSGMTERVTLQMKGSVVRKDPAGIAISFDSMDLDSYTHLKNIVRYNTENPDDVH